MARGDGILRRIITAVFDRASAEKVEAEFEKTLGDGGKKAGASFLRELRKQFDTKMADLKVQLAKGIIDEKQFRKQADLAAKEFNTGLVKGLEGARQAGKLTDDVYLRLSKSIKRVRGEGETMFDRLKGAALRAGAAIAAAFTLRAVIDFGREAIRAASESEAAWSRLAGTIEATGIAWDTIEPKLREFADRFQRGTIHDDDAFADALQRLIVISGDVEASLNNVVLVADVAAQFFEGDLSRAADVVGRAMLGDTEQLKRLGIETKNAQEALDILASRSMNAATREAETFAGKVAQLRNEWDDFKKAIGQTLTQGEGGTGVLDVLLATLRSINQAVEKNSGAVRAFGDLLKWLGGEIIARTLSIAFLPLLTTVELLAEGYGLAARGAAWFGRVIGADTATIEAHVEKVNALADAIEGVRQKAAETALHGVDFAGAPGVRAGGTTGSTSPLARPRPIAAQRGVKLEPPGSLGDLVRGSTESVGNDIGKASARQAESFASPWLKALSAIHDEVMAEKGLFADLARAWVDGGFSGIIAYAKGKVKENLAAAIEMGAKALGALFFGNAPAAAAAAKSAAMHGAAAAAWGVLAKSGGGGGRSVPIGGGVGGTSAGVNRGASAEARGAEVHIYIDPLDPGDPRYQSIHAETDRIARERHGANANVTYHRRTGS